MGKFVVLGIHDGKQVTRLGGVEDDLGQDDGLVDKAGIAGGKIQALL